MVCRCRLPDLADYLTSWVMNSPTGCRLKAHQRSVAAHMRVYDQLPSEIRHALAEARSNFCPMWCRDNVRRYGTELAMRLVSEKSERDGTSLTPAAPRSGAQRAMPRRWVRS